jgi:hypothetical protein
MDRIREDTIIAVEESDDEEGKEGSASELGSCPDLIVRTWSAKQTLAYWLVQGSQKMRDVQFVES